MQAEMILRLLEVSLLIPSEIILSEQFEIDNDFVSFRYQAEQCGLSGI